MTAPSLIHAARRAPDRRERIILMAEAMRSCFAQNSRQVGMFAESCGKIRSRRSLRQFRSPIFRDLCNARLQSLTIVLARFTMAKLVERDNLSFVGCTGDNLGLCLSLQEGNAGLLIATPDKARATSFAMSLDEQIDFIRDGNGVREYHSCSIWRHVSDEAIYCETLMTVRNGSAEECSAALQLTTFKHGPASCYETAANLDPTSSKSFATYGRLSCLTAIKVNYGAPSIPLVGVAA